MGRSRFFCSHRVRTRVCLVRGASFDMSPRGDANGLAAPMVAASSSMQVVASDPSVSDARPSLKRSPSGHSWLADRIPKAPRTGNSERDSLADRDRACFQDIIDACLSDPLNIACAYGAIQRRRATMNLEVSMGDANSTFAKVTQIDRLDVKWLMQFVTQHTDLTMSDIFKIYKMDTAGPLELFSYLTELPFALRLPKQCLVKWVLFELARDRHRLCGNRGAEFKRRGGVNDDGTINWREHGAYELKFENGRCVQVLHRMSGLAATPPEGIIVTTKFVLRNNFSDHLAFVECAPIPPIKLAKFFEMQAAGGAPAIGGPFAYRVCSGGHNKNLNDLAAAKYKEWEREQEKADISKEVTQGMAEAKSAQTKERLKIAREKAAQSLQAKRQKRTITLE